MGHERPSLKVTRNLPREGYERQDGGEIQGVWLPKKGKGRSSKGGEDRREGPVRKMGSILKSWGEKNDSRKFDVP